jgi:hypothetical protein
MAAYHNIQTMYRRDPENHYATLLEGQFARPEFTYLKNKTTRNAHYFKRERS